MGVIRGADPAEVEATRGIHRVPVTSNAFPSTTSSPQAAAATLRSSLPTTAITAGSGFTSSR
jgi:hypothetical protein